MLIFDPHRLGCVDGRASADGYDPVGLEFFHFLRAIHNGRYRRIGFDTLDQCRLHACLMQILLSSSKEAKALHRSSADADDGFFTLQRLQCLE